MTQTPPDPAARPAQPTYLVLGPGPRPATGRELVSAIEAAVRREVPSMRLPSIAADLDGADVRRLEVDLTGLDVSATDEALTSASAEGAAATDPPSVIARESATLRETVVRAHPIQVQGVPVDLDLTVRDLPMEWLSLSDGTTAVDTPGGGDDVRVTGSVRGSVPVEPAVRAARGLVQEQARAAGFRVSSLDLDLQQAGRNTVDVRGFARLGKGPFTASARLGATVAVGDDLVLRASSVRVRSGHPIVGLALLGFRRRIVAALEQPVPLGETLLGPGQRVSDLQITVGETLTVAGRLV